ncbi:uncharacterized protein LOC131174125 [Hevea brasiliensis]|uniref:uncharacterized protein LOC131174125 n=1 Tax=Hevea brasiliensis TaxID=3981 RepID=UPI0025DC7A51|nr:uncharacterized protein LOC131174125 [Hevea brasiliensis]
MKGATVADAQTPRCELVEVPSSPPRPQEQPIPEVEVVAPAPQQIELPLLPPFPISSNVEGEASGPTVRTLSRGAQLLIQSLERNRSTRENSGLAKVMGASICFQEDQNRLAEESIDDILAQTMSLGLEAIANKHVIREKAHALRKEILKAVQDALAAQAQLSSANDYIAGMENRMKHYEERIAEVKRELEDSRVGRSADLARFVEDLRAKEEDLRAKEEELRAKDEEFIIPNKKISESKQMQQHYTPAYGKLRGELVYLSSPSEKIHINEIIDDQWRNICIRKLINTRTTPAA